VRRAPQHAVRDRDLPGLDRGDLLADRDHGVAEPVDLAEVLTLGGLDHERAGDREGHRGRVEAVVDQPLGHVVDGDTAASGQLAQVEDALVRDDAVVP
jgi:hypothetical protein